MNLQAAQLGSSMYMPMGGSIPKTYQPKARQYLMNAAMQGVGGALSDAVMKKLMTQQISPEQVKALGIENQVPQEHWYRPNFTVEQGEQLSHSESERGLTQAQTHKTGAEAEQVPLEGAAHRKYLEAVAAVDQMNAGTQLTKVQLDAINQNKEMLIAQGHLNVATADQKLREQSAPYEHERLAAGTKLEQAQASEINQRTSSLEAGMPGTMASAERTNRMLTGQLMGITPGSPQETALNEYMMTQKAPTTLQEFQQFQQGAKPYIEQHTMKMPDTSGAGISDWFFHPVDRAAQVWGQAQNGPHPQAAPAPAPSSAPAPAPAASVQPPAQSAGAGAASTSSLPYALTTAMAPGLTGTSASTPILNELGKWGNLAQSEQQKWGNIGSTLQGQPPPVQGPGVPAAQIAPQNPELVKQWLTQLGIQQPAAQ